MNETTANRPVIFGEVLFDRFPGGHDVLGGAPFNVAWHLQGFGAAPLLISRVGDDDQGRQVLAAMQAWGMDTRGIQTDRDRPTGQVRIEMSGGSHRFEILPDQAYDHVDAGQAERAIAGITPALLYLGSLAARHHASRHALETLQGRIDAQFVDINLRAPWWEPALVHELMQGARWLKLNDEELEILTEAAAGSSLRDRAAGLRERYGLDLLVLTLGADGALFLSDEGELQGRPPPVADVQDTVGAGDAFAAVVILGLLNDWPLAAVLERALAFSARICAQRGATADDPELYAVTLREWAG